MKCTGLLLFFFVLGTVESIAGDRVVAPASLPAIGGSWVSQGPGPILDGQVEGITGFHVIGAIQTIVAHPTNPDIAWIGAVNGGVWKTTNATNASPTWTAAGDAFTSLSIGAMNLDPTDGTHDTLVAAFGRFSSFSSVGGPRGGLLRTTNGGSTWTQLNPATLSGKNMSGIAARGATIVVSVNNADSFFCSNLGIFRSIDTGSSFAIVSGTGALPLGRAFDLATDPTNNAILYAAIRDAEACSAGINGIYRSADTGATWTRVSSAAMDALMTDTASPRNTRIAVGASGQVFVAIVNGSGQLSGLFRSPASPGSGTWTQLDTPSTNEGGTIFGVHPSAKPGSQGGTHLSIVADPTDANIVYVGGDRQPLSGEGNTSTPNSIGATNYTGRLFRVNAGAGSGSQVTPLTHCTTATVACNSTISTSSNSSPHADSRRMVFDADGNILEGDDGGIFRRTNPRTTGDWFSVNGNLRVNEMHDVAYDRVSNMIISGNQDTGTAEQTAVDGTTWTEVTSGDGGDVAVDDFTSGTQSTRYSSFQNLGAFLRRGVNSSGVATSFTNPSLTVTGGGPAFVGQFATPVEVNSVDGTGILFAGSNDLYESLDRGDTITALAFNRTANAMVFGGRSGGIDNINLIYAISAQGPTVNGPNVFVRTAGSGPPLETVDPTGATAIRDIAVDPDDWQTAFVVDSSGQVFTSTNTGGSWTNITGNLASGSTDLRTILFVPGSPDAVIVGGVNGVFRMAMNDVGVWQQFGNGLSNAPVWDLDYDAADDTLVAGTMGRGAWKLNPVGNLGPIPTLSINDVAVSEGNAGTTNATFTVSLSAPSGVPVTVNYSTADGTAGSGTTTATNAASISIPTSGNATPYPATATVSGVSGTITKVTATLTGFSHTFRRDVDVLLVGPAGQSVVLMSDAGGTGTATGLNLTFDDAAAAAIVTGSPSGTYQPTNINDSEGSDTYSSPAPASGYGSALSVFNTTSPNGTWSLFVVDDIGPDGGSISGGFTLNITTNGGDYVAQSGLVTFAPTVTSQPITILVNGDVNVESNETFVVNLSTPGNATVLDGQGQGTITDDDGVVVLAPTNVLASATAPTSVNITWTASAGAASYRVYRKDSSAGSFSLVGSPGVTAFDDTTASSGTAYFYMVRAFNGTESVDSNTDLATTVIFTDPTLTSATLAKLAHFSELLTAVNAVLTFAGESTIAFTAPAPTTSVTVRAQHVLDLRTGLDDARSTLALSALSYTDPSLVGGSTAIKSAHLTDLRNGVK
jgi:photosystem II stability/assembly factor-like uncharacterized protein/subtilisin-like proprotein convertase family protein